MGEAIVFTSGKGGVGKTTTIANIGAGLSRLDKKVVMLDTDMGLLTIKGKDLHVNRLSLEKGEIDIEGRTDSLVYSAGGGTKSGGSFWAKLFK